MKSNPIILESIDGPGRELKRISSLSGDLKDEAWLQELIFRHPHLLPINQFDDSLTEIIPLARELATNAGYIDNLYITLEGRLIIVETKLWKNPEQHRTVVAQIIDYAKEVSAWSYDDLDNAVLKARRRMYNGDGQSIDEIIRPSLEQRRLSSAEFQERVIENMRTGRFLLLIVGDKISPNVAMLSAAIHGVPGLEFQLGLVEIMMHPLSENSDWPMIVISDVVGRTSEETRAVVKVHYVQERPKVQVTVPTSEKLSVRGSASLESFRAEMPEDIFEIFESWVREWEKRGHIIRWRSRGMTFRIDIGGKELTTFEVYPDALHLLGKGDEIVKRFDSYDEYRKDIQSVPQAYNLIVAGKKVMRLEDLSAEEFETIIEASLSFGERLAAIHE